MKKIEFNEHTIVDLVEKMIFKALGCTEPVAAALAIAVAYREIGGEVKSVKVALDKNVFKNAMAVGIPGTNQKGPKIAIALGIVCGDPKKGLLLLEDVTPEAIIKAQDLIDRDLIQITLDNSARCLNVQAEIETSKGVAKAIISQCHDNIVLIEKNGKIIYHRIENTAERTNFLDDYDFSSFNFDQLAKLIEKIPLEEIKFLEEGFALNNAAAKIGLQKGVGMGLGTAYQRLIDQNIIENNFINQAKMLASAAVDARMGGLKVPIYGCAGSGSHGIGFFIAIGVCLQRFPIKRKVSLQHVYVYGLVVLAAIKQAMGLLSPICGGAVAVGAAAAAAIVYALNGNAAKINNAINLVVGNISGIVCDGAKDGCALKIDSGVTVAIQSALLALEGATISLTDGIIGKDFNDTLNNLSMLDKLGMEKVDETILHMLKNKNR